MESAFDTDKDNFSDRHYPEGKRSKMNEQFKHDVSLVLPQAEPDVAAPFRPFGHSHRHGKGEREHNPREGGFPQGRHFKKFQSDENRGFGQKKKPFFHKQKDR